jgi:hypothetical protein
MTRQDPLNLITESRLELLAQLGLSNVVDMQWLGARGGCAHYLLNFSDDVGHAQLAVELMAPSGRSPIELAFAAQHQLQLVEDVPSYEAFRPLPIHVFGARAVVHDAIGLVTGGQRLAADPSCGSVLAQDVGLILAATARVPVVAPGLFARGGRFVSTASTWRELWLNYVGQLERCILAAGVDLGSLSSRVVRTIEKHAGALDEVEQFALVHGTMAPDSLRYRSTDSGMELALVADWWQAMAGDPLVDLGPLSFLEQDLFQQVVRQRCDQLGAELTSDEHQRILLYRWTTCLWQLGQVADALTQCRDASGLALLDGARRMCRLALGDEVPSHDALGASNRDRVLSVARVVGVPPAETTGALIAALGACEAVARCGDEDLACIADDVAGGLGARLMTFGLAGGSDGAPAWPERGYLASAVRWLGGTAIARAGDVSVSVEAGLKRLAWAVSGESWPVQPEKRLGHALLATAAASALGLPELEDYADTLRDAWELASGKAATSPEHDVSWELLEALGADGHIADRPLWILCAFEAANWLPAPAADVVARASL